MYFLWAFFMLMKLKDILAKIKNGEKLNKEEISFLESKGYNKKGDKIYIANFAKKSIKPKEKEIELGKSIVHLQFNVKKIKELSTGLLRAIISSEALDRHEEQLTMKGGDFSKYLANPILANNHDYSHPSVGRTHKLTKKHSGELVADFEFATDIDGYEMPKILDQLYRKGYQFAFSIGFIPKEMQGNNYTKWEMIEFSPVLIGANQEALLLNFAKSKGIEIDLNKKETEPTQKSKKSEKIKNQEEISEMKLKDILAKIAMGEDVTAEEKAFLLTKTAELTDKQKALCADLLAPADDKEKEALKSQIADLTTQMKTLTEQFEKIDAPTKKTFTLKKGIDKTKKEIKFLYFVRGLVSKDFREYENVVGKAAMTTSEPGEVLPPSEFMSEVERLEENYGVARQFAQLKTSSNGSGVRYLQGDGDVDVYWTDEAGRKQSSKNSYAEKLLAWRKAAGIMPMTDELEEDSAVNLWADATNRFARAFAKKEDQLVFTMATGSAPINGGLLTVAGTVPVTMSGDSFFELDADDLIDMVYAVPTPSEVNGRYYFNRSLMPIIKKLKDDNGQYLFEKEISKDVPSTINGKPYSLVEIMPNANTDDAVSTPFAVFGDLKYVTLGQRTGMNIKIFDSGMVGDPAEETQGDDLNLITQDMKAMRAVKRMNAVVRFPGAFSVLKTSLSGS